MSPWLSLQLLFVCSLLLAPSAERPKGALYLLVDRSRFGCVCFVIRLCPLPADFTLTDATPTHVPLQLPVVLALLLINPCLLPLLCHSLRVHDTHRHNLLSYVQQHCLLGGASIEPQRYGTAVRSRRAAAVNPVSHPGHIFTSPLAAALLLLLLLLLMLLQILSPVPHTGRQEAGIFNLPGFGRFMLMATASSGPSRVPG